MVRSCLVGMSVAFVFFVLAILCVPAGAECVSQCVTVDPVNHVPMNLDESSAATIDLDTGCIYRVWAEGASGHAPEHYGIYSDVLVASPGHCAAIFSVPIDGEIVTIKPDPTMSVRRYYLFFVEFGSGELGDNWGGTDVFFQPIDGGDILSVHVDPVSNVIFNCATEECQVMPLDLSTDRMIAANGAAQYADVMGHYGGVYLCVQWGLNTILKALSPNPIGDPLFLPDPGFTGTDPAYLWFPEFGSGYTGDNSGQIEVCSVRQTADIQAPETGALDPTMELESPPNPLREQSTIHYSIDTAGPVSLEIYDVSGRMIRSLVRGDQPAGMHEVRWDGWSDSGARVATGLYYLRMTTPSGELDHSVVITR